MLNKRQKETGLFFFPSSSELRLPGKLIFVKFAIEKATFVNIKSDQ